jgi:GTP-binding protein Era
VNIPKILVLNKTDIVTAAKIQERRTYFTEQVTFSDVVEISALKGENVGQLRELILRHLPLSPPYYDKEELSDRPERFFISEMIREKIFLFLSDEIPYSCEVEVLTFESTHSKAGEPLVRISANIHVERNTQKQILIGEGARTVKKIGTAARKDIEEFLQSKVFLEIFVKVSPDWKTKDNYLRSFGYAK